MRKAAILTILLFGCLTAVNAFSQSLRDQVKTEREKMRKERGVLSPVPDQSSSKEPITQSQLEYLSGLEKQLEKDPSNIKLILETALYNKMAEKLERAAALYDQALKMQPDQPEALFNLGAVRLEMGRSREALMFFQQFIRKYPEDPNIKAVHQAQYRAISDLCSQEGADPTGLLPFERVELVIYRKLKKEDTGDGKFQAFMGKEILDRTSQVSIMLKNITDAPIKYNFHNFHLEQEGIYLYYDPARFLPGTDNQPITGSLDPGKYLYLVIGCPEYDLTLPVTLKYEGGEGIDFTKTF